VHSSFVIVKRNCRDRRLRSLRIGGPDRVSERNGDFGRSRWRGGRYRVFEDWQLWRVEISWVTEKGGPCDGALVDRKLRFIANKGRAS
jgi:hypothetical protein